MAQFFKLGTLLANTVGVMPYGASLTAFDPYLANGQRTFMVSAGPRRRGQD
jgi:hypothetical protein